VIAQLKNAANSDLAAKTRGPGHQDRAAISIWTTPGNLDRSFADAIVNLEKAVYTEVPVKTLFGYHVSRSTTLRTVRVPTLARSTAALTIIACCRFRDRGDVARAWSHQGEGRIARPHEAPGFFLLLAFPDGFFTKTSRKLRSARRLLRWHDGAFDKVPGVTSAVSGYMGGHSRPELRAGSSGMSGHSEVCVLLFRPAKVATRTVWNVFGSPHPHGDLRQFATSARNTGPSISTRLEQKRLAEASKAKRGTRPTPFKQPSPHARKCRAGERLLAGRVYHHLLQDQPGTLHSYVTGSDATRASTISGST